MNKEKRLLTILKSNDVNVDILKENDVCLMGGSILKLMMDLPLDSDLDLYFKDYEKYKNVDDYFRDSFECIEETNAFKNYKCKDLVVQLIWNNDNNVRWGKGSYDDVVSNFDFTIITGGYEFKNEMFRYSQTYFDDISHKRLICNHWPLRVENYHSNEKLLGRIEKFKKMGFTISSDLLNQIRELR